jgi:hypothetical protein
MYVGRADSENRIKELKEDLSFLDTFCLKSFDDTDVAFRTCSAICCRSFVRRSCRARGLKDGYGRLEILSFWWARI